MTRRPTETQNPEDPRRGGPPSSPIDRDQGRPIDPDQNRYRLIDFGGGRKLESFAGYLVDRPSPAAESFPRHAPDRWRLADARFDAHQRRWHHKTPLPESLAVDCGGFRMPIRLTPYGHVGLFPEQAPNWQWLARHQPPTDTASRDTAPRDTGSPDTASPAAHALNLFAYTGASSMALLAAGFRVAHVDAAKPNVEAAKRALEANRWGDRPIRFLVDDAMKFAAREIRRGRRYHTVVLDPPAYGHGPKGRTWRIARDLWPLLDLCFDLVEPESFRLLVTGHSPDVGPDEVVRYVRDALGRRASAGEPTVSAGGAVGLRTESGRSQLNDLAGRHLDAGFYVRIVSGRA